MFPVRMDSSDIRSWLPPLRRVRAMLHKMILSSARAMAAILCCLFVFTPLPCEAGNLRVLVVLSDSSSPYQSFANTLSNSFPASIQASVLEQPEQVASQPPVDLIVSVGMKATLSAITRTVAPVLAVMIPKVGYAELLAQTSAQRRTQEVSAIYLDQPWVRQLDFIHAILPAHSNIGLLYSPNAHIDLAYLRQRVSEHGATLVAKPVMSSEEIFSSLDELLESSDVLLALPDNTIYNSINIRDILLSSYRYNIPFIGISQAYVTAGALGAIFSSPQQLSDQITATIISFARTGKLPEPQYPRDFTIAVNPEVARSLDIELLPVDAIRSQMNVTNKGIP